MSGEYLHWKKVKISLLHLSEYFGTKSKCEHFINDIERDTGSTDLSVISNLYPYGYKSGTRFPLSDLEKKYIPHLNEIFKYSVSKESLVVRRAVMVFMGEHLHLIKPKLMYSRVILEYGKNGIHKSGGKRGGKKKKETEEIKYIMSFFSNVQYEKCVRLPDNSHTNKDSSVICETALLGDI